MAIRVVMGYDGSPEAGAAIDAGGLLFPGAHGWITYLWVPPFASDKVRRRLRARARDVNELIAMVEQEGQHEAQRLVATGVTLARAAGWEAEPLLKRSWGGEGWRIAQAAEEVDADLVLVGSRGLGGTQAVLGSVSDMVVHYSARPMLVVPHPMLTTEYAALPEGPVVVGWDGSPGAEAAFTAATRLFPQRDVLLVSVGEEADDTASPADVRGSGPRVTALRVDHGRGFRGHAIADALIAAARGRDAAVIVVGSRGRSVARELVLGSVAMATLHTGERPVMVVPRQWEASF
ncbi:universal stress protein [Mycolicibacterium pyrenivorans]|uniref:universal stress protein n=1 Tax=Mycolicibacterium pyrenivorans TaxID=187102 RepID=UPI0021F34E7D|nr:universal stress protein [Mycolicibacterium pyrenivorans]MCV7154418.1 universal stress protein [Mycolicibacterium pyrenivorans]